MEALINTTPTISEAMDTFQQQLMGFEAVECPLTHLFTKGLYTRQIFMPAYSTNSKGEQVQTVIISKIHKTQHPYIITKGKAMVFNSKYDSMPTLLEAPHVGVTEPNSRRILKIEEDTKWITLHPLDYITGEENEWGDEEKEFLLKWIEMDLIQEHEIFTCNKELEAIA